MKEINITYQSYIPSELIADFTELVQPVRVNKKELKKGPWNHFESTVINDVTIWINQLPTEFVYGSIAGGILGNAAWAILKAALKLLWAGISKLPIKILHAGTQTDKRKSILLRFSDKNRGIEIVFEGDVNEQQANSLIDSLIEYLNSEKVNDAFYNSDNIQDNSKIPEIRIIYNWEKGIWEPENFGEKRRKMDELKNWAQRNLRS
jgi:hypothetical protein